MTDRDTFAAAALTGLMRFRGDSGQPGVTWKSTALIAAEAYELADAMLRWRGTADRDNREMECQANHDAAPAARARTDADSDRTDKAVLRPGEGTGDTKPMPDAATDSGSVTAEPVAWALMERDGFGIEGTFTDRDEACEWCDNRQQIVPLYRQPHHTLTDAEREALERVSVAYDLLPTEGARQISATLRGLLERMK